MHLLGRHAPNDAEVTGLVAGSFWSNVCEPQVRQEVRSNLEEVGQAGGLLALTHTWLSYLDLATRISTGSRLVCGGDLPRSFS